MRIRPRRTRQTPAIRSMVQDTHVCAHDLVMPFIVHDQANPTPIPTLDGHYRWDISSLLRQCEQALTKGIRAVALFPCVDPAKKTSTADHATDPDNIMCQATRAIKQAFGHDLVVIGDVALDPYSSDGHDGLVAPDGRILNDDTVSILADMAVVQARAGVDIVAPSDMMDGRVREIRRSLDDHNFQDTLIMSYTAKYASNFYQPFRDALDSAPSWGDKNTYQMDFHNRREAQIELDLDIQEGADMVMVKPAGLYLDIISDYRSATNRPVVAYHVSGEYAMLKVAEANGILEFEPALLEVLTAIKRAGASFILTYGALEIL